MFDRGEAARKLVLNMARLSGLAPLAQHFAGGVGAILMLHRVTAAPSGPLGLNRHLAIAPDFLDALLADMQREGYRFVSMDEAVDRLSRRAQGERFAAVTLDDGYRDNLVEALPIFEKHETPFTVYVAPALTDGAVAPWWEVLEAVVSASSWVELNVAGNSIVLDCSTPRKKMAAVRRIDGHLSNEVPEEAQPEFIERLARSVGLDAAATGRAALMDWCEIGRIAAHPLGSIGAHTVHHFNLARLSRDSALREMTDASAILSERLGERPRHLAYPYGYARAVAVREVELAREAGYVSAVTTRHGLLQPGHARHLHALPRISVNGRYQRLAHIRTMLSGVTTPLANRGRRLVTV